MSSEFPPPPSNNFDPQPQIDSPYQQQQQGMPPKKKNVALIVLICVVVGSCCLCVPIGAAVLFPVFSQAKIAAQKTNDLGTLKSIGMSMQIYLSDNEDVYPKAEQWQDLSEPYLNEKEVVNTGNEKRGFAFNSNLSEASATEFADSEKTASFFASTNTERNANDACESLYLYAGKPLIGFADANTRFIAPGDKVFVDQKATKALVVTPGS